ncbi:hypothetical protein [Actinoplanes couchii]|uniref:hypothetical protein n=1 Tax=Actinoplanes couchii TaxID=403638 RepID=UPI001943B4C4|nr:hypothetical protein [Actinoplanes couchii]MDR6317581.1 hypothetical protein [Actinoplanes couchii]
MNIDIDFLTGAHRCLIAAPGRAALRRFVLRWAGLRRVVLRCAGLRRVGSQCAVSSLVASSGKSAGHRRPDRLTG